MPLTYEQLKLGTQKRKRAGVFLRCEKCAAEFYVMPCRIRQAEKQGVSIRYCSAACYDRSGVNAPMFGKKHSEDSIRKMAEHPNRSRFKTGDENPNFVRFGADYKHQAARRLRERLLEERGAACEKCGYDTVPGVIEIHHEDRDRSNNDRANLKLLCPTCHAVDHYIAGDGSFNRLKKRV